MTVAMMDDLSTEITKKLELDVADPNYELLIDVCSPLMTKAFSCSVKAPFFILLPTSEESISRYVYWTRT